MDFSARTTTLLAERATTEAVTEVPPERVSVAVPDAHCSSRDNTSAPELATAAVPPAASGAPRPTDAADLLLPHGWRIARDSTTGNFYFYHTTTGAVQWEPPDAAAATAAAGRSGAGRETMLAIVVD